MHNYPTSGAVYIMHKDWLGNARLVSDLATTVIGDYAFAPYGEKYDIFGSTSQNETMFIGLTQDVLAGVYDTPNRELQGSQQGRWLSPDPAGSGWNQYAYATNPNSFVDPSGLQLCAPGCGGCTIDGCGSNLSGGGSPGAGDGYGYGSVGCDAGWGCDAINFINGSGIYGTVYGTAYGNGSVVWGNGSIDPSGPSILSSTDITTEGLTGAVDTLTVNTIASTEYTNVIAGGVGGPAETPYIIQPLGLIAPWCLCELFQGFFTMGNVYGYQVKNVFGQPLGGIKVTESSVIEVGTPGTRNQSGTVTTFANGEFGDLIGEGFTSPITIDTFGAFTATQTLLAGPASLTVKQSFILFNGNAYTSATVVAF